MENFEHEDLIPENVEPVEYEKPTAKDTSGENMYDDRQLDTHIPHREVRTSADNSSYRGVGAGRKESPYADSPYVMNHAAPSERYYREADSAYRETPASQFPENKPRHTANRRKAPIGKRILAAAAILLLVISSCGITAMLVNNHWEARTRQMQQELVDKLEDLEIQVEAQVLKPSGSSASGIAPVAEGYSAGQVYAQNVHSVVLIESTVVSTMYGQTATGMSAGSGFILSEDGYIITNYHVIQGATSVQAVLYDGTRLDVSVAGYDSTNDIAVLKAEVFGLDPVTLGSSNDLIVGDQVVAIGNPLGELTSTLTVGYVSAKERDVSTDGTVINMIQTDAAINSGNSGGPLFNMKGEVVGITTAKYSGASSSGASIEGIGFAIPIDDVLEEIDDLIAFGYIKSAYMGVEVQSLDPSVAEIYGLPVGAYVAKVVEGGAAHRAGIQAKDIITRVGDISIETLTDLTRALREFEPGDTAQVEIYRGGMVMTVQVTLDERPRDLDTAASDPQTDPQTDPQMPEGSYEDWFNFFSPFFGNGD